MCIILGVWEKVTDFVQPFSNRGTVVDFRFHRNPLR